jgi:hypothetical protein
LWWRRPSQAGAIPRPASCLYYPCLTFGVQSKAISSQVNDCCNAQSARVSQLMATRQEGTSVLRIIRALMGHNAGHGARAEFQARPHARDRADRWAWWCAGDVGRRGALCWSATVLAPGSTALGFCSRVASERRRDRQKARRGSSDPPRWSARCGLKGGCDAPRRRDHLPP